MQRFSAILYFSIFVFLAPCSLRAVEVHSKVGHIQKTFDLQKTTRKYRSLDEVQKIKLLLRLLDAKFKNQAIFSRFLNEAIAQLPFVLTKESTPHYIKLQSQLYYSPYEPAQFALAHRIYAARKKTDSSTLKRILPYALVTLGYKYSQTNQLDSLAVINEQLRKVWSNKLPNWIKLEYLSKKAYLVSKKGDFYRALIYYNDALRYTTHADKENISYLYHNMANLYLSLENHQRANYYANLSIAQIGLKNYPKEQLNLIGTIQSKAGQFDKANQNFEMALKYATAQQLMSLQAQILSNYGNSKRKQKAFSEALKMMNASDSICKSMNLDVGILINGINRAELFLDQKKFNLADRQMFQILNILNATFEPRLRYGYFKLYARIKDACGKRSVANEYLRRATETKEQFGGDTPQALISHWELKNEKNKARHARDRYELMALKQQQLKNTIIFSLLLSILLGAFIFLYFLRRQALKNASLFMEQQRMNFELELKSKELFAETLKNQSIVHVKNEIKEGLERIVKNKTYSAQEIKEIIRSLGKTDSATFLDEFETRFNGVHSDFYVKLKQIAPDLTPHELRLSALIRLNISSKEIAVLTNRTVGTIDNTRSTIRRKLRIDESQNLQDFILNL